MNKTALLVVGGGLCCCVLAALVLLAYFVLNGGNRKGDPYKGLPTTLDKSGLSDAFRISMEQLESIKSDCWHMNHLALVTLPPYVRKLDALQKDVANLGQKKFEKQSQELLDAFVKDIEAALAKCPDSVQIKSTNPMTGDSQTATKQQVLDMLKLVRNFDRLLQELSEQQAQS